MARKRRPTHDEVQTAKHHADQLHRHYIALFRRRHQVGGVVAWKKRSAGKICFGTITLVDYGDRLRVRNATTDKEYWIAAWQVVDA